MLLDLVGEWINRRPGGQRNLLDVGVVHIDESALLPLTPEEVGVPMTRDQAQIINSLRDSTRPSNN